jgi:hypothetical protein
MSDSVRSDIKSKVCEDSSPACAVEISEEVYSLDELSLNSEFAPSMQHFRPDPIVHSLAGKSMIPKFSKGCDTGQYEDSYENAAGTPEAKKYVSEAGVDSKATWVLDLSKKNGDTLFSFGHLKKSH